MRKSDKYLFDPHEIEWAMKPTRQYVADVLNVPVEKIGEEKIVDGRPTITMTKAQLRRLAVLARKAREAGL